MHAGYGTASLPEIIWTIGAIAGVIMTQYTYRIARKSQGAIQQLNVNGLAGRSASAILIGEITRGFVFTIMAVLGIAAMLIPPGTPDGDPPPAAWLAMMGFLLIQGALVLWTVSDIRMIRDILLMARTNRDEWVRKYRIGELDE